MLLCVMSCRSPLQLPKGGLLLIDELTLGEGKLSETGVKSLQALNGMLLNQVSVTTC